MAIEIWGGQTMDLRQRPGSIHEANRDGTITKAAIMEGMPLSRYLEGLDPTDKWEGDSWGRDLDAFGRQVKFLGIRTVSNPVEGIFASDFGDFEKKGARGLVHEFCARRWREARYGKPVNPRSGGVVRVDPQGRQIFTSADEGLGTIWRPIFEAAGERTSQIAAPIPLSALVAQSSSIPTDTYKAAYVADPTAEQLRKYRVGETAEIPLTTFTVGEQAITIYKYGRGFGMSYEAARRSPIDKVSFWVARAALQDEMDKVEQAVDTLINGDGNSNSATSYNLTDLHTGATLGTITPRALIAFKGKFSNAYAIDTMFAREEDWIDIQMLTMPNANPMVWQYASQFGAFRNMNMTVDQTVALGKLDILATDKIIGIDTRFALEHVMEIGAQITEAQKFITSQTDVVVMTEVEGFAVLDKLATRILNLAA